MASISVLIGSILVVLLESIDEILPEFDEAPADKLLLLLSYPSQEGEGGRASAWGMIGRGEEDEDESAVVSVVFIFLVAEGP